MSTYYNSGVPTTSTVTVGTSPTLLVPKRQAVGPTGSRTGYTIMNTGSVDVTIGGVAVIAGVGPVLIAQASPTTIPHAYSNSTSNQALYGIVASGTGTIQVLEEVCA